MVATINAVEISFPVPRAPYAILHGHLTFEAGYTMIHLTTSELGESVGSSASFGSFVYAMPDVGLGMVYARFQADSASAHEREASLEYDVSRYWRERRLCHKTCKDLGAENATSRLRWM